MTTLLLAVIPIVLTALFAGQFAVTRTGRLRKDILANLDLLGRLPAEHPNRAALEAKNGELVGVLARRQQRRYGPFTPAGVSFASTPASPSWRWCSLAQRRSSRPESCPRPRPTWRPLGTSGPQRRSSSSARPGSLCSRSGPPAGSSGSTHHRPRPARACFKSQGVP